MKATSVVVGMLGGAMITGAAMMCLVPGMKHKAMRCMRRECRKMMRLF